MSRYRPPTTPGSRFITPEGHARMTRELDELWRVERPRVTQAVSEAAAQGDRSENAEYTYGKRRLREIDSRVRFLRKRLEGMVVVDQPPADRARVFFGAWVTLEDEAGEQRADDADEDHTREQPVDRVFLAADDADGAVGDDHEHRCADGQQGSDTVVMLRFDGHVAGVTWGNGRDERI